MTALLAGLKGRFIPSLNDIEQVRHAFASSVEQVETTYSAHDINAEKRAREAIITGR